jgi:hypothetical protein
MAKGYQVCVVCRRYIAGTIKDPVIHLSSGVYDQVCFRRKCSSSVEGEAKPEIQQVPVEEPPPTATPQSEEGPEEAPGEYPWEL